MRLITWNCCRGAYHKKVPLLDSLRPDIAVIQECAKPLVSSEQCLWFGDNPRQGVAVHAYGDYRLRTLPPVADVPRYVIPVEVSGPINFLLMAVWAKGDRPWPYVEGVIRAVELYRDIFRQLPAVFAGDFNSNAIWDSSHRNGRNHTGLVKLLSELGLESGYHAFYQEEHGKETQATFDFRKSPAKPFHIDYCFVPKGWLPALRGVEIGTYQDWTKHSDHRPLLVDVFDPMQTAEMGG
ncbi:MAG: endonuclease/exonuclease/phosphatase family protein [Acidobacteriota bacterium]